MITNGIIFKNFLINKKFKQVTKDLNFILKKKNQIIQSLSGNYKNSFKIKKLSKYKKFQHFRVIGMGGSSLGTQAIYDFLRKKISFFIQTKLSYNNRNTNISLKFFTKLKVFNFLYFVNETFQLINFNFYTFHCIFTKLCFG